MGFAFQFDSFISEKGYFDLSAWPVRSSHRTVFIKADRDHNSGCDWSSFFSNSEQTRTCNPRTSRGFTFEFEPSRTFELLERYCWFLSFEPQNFAEFPHHLFSNKNGGNIKKAKKISFLRGCFSHPPTEGARVLTNWKRKSRNSFINILQSFRGIG